METYHRGRLAELGITGEFVQDNLSFSHFGVLRGIHFQYPNPQGRLVSALQGEVFDVAVDLRSGSPQFRKWSGVILSEDNRRELWIPPGFGHGFLVMSEAAMVAYRCTDC